MDLVPGSREQVLLPAVCAGAKEVFKKFQKSLIEEDPKGLQERLMGLFQKGF